MITLGRLETMYKGKLPSGTMAIKTFRKRFDRLPDTFTSGDVFRILKCTQAVVSKILHTGIVYRLITIEVSETDKRRKIYHKVK